MELETNSPAYWSTVGDSVIDPGVDLSISATTFLRAQLEQQVRSTDPPADLVVHTTYHAYTPSGTPPYSTFATAVMSAWLNGSGTSPTYPWASYINRGLTLKVYDMADAKPRPVRAQVVHTPTTWETYALGPREVAIPLRYYCTRNVVRSRGRLYLGPWAAGTTTMGETVSNIFQQTCLDLGLGLATVPGASYVWCLYSDTDAAYKQITNLWVNDLWAHMTSREHVEAARATLPA
jgi:hypothetical protein